MKKGIKRRVVWSYLVLIIFSVALFEAIILFALRVYYVDGIKQTLRDQGRLFSSYYEKELINNELLNAPGKLLNQYRLSVSAEVQLIDLKGNIIADTHQNNQKSIGDYEDVKSALSGGTGYLDTNAADGERILYVTQPLKRGSTVIGAIRFTTSMERLNHVFTKNMLILLSFGGIVILTAAIISFFLANTITKPISAITKAAEQMASGKFATRIKKENEDEIGKLADTLNYMAIQIEKHEQLKNEFIASVSHELRTPLTSIKGWAVTLNSMSEEDFFRDGLEIISTESDRLNQLLNDLLDFSSLTSGKLPLVFENVTLAPLLQQVIHQLTPRAQRQGIKLTGQIDEELEPVLADQNRLKQVLMNLLDNAFKFTPYGGTIIVMLKSKGKEAIIKVIDSGRGISEEDLQLVKKKFYKGKSKGAGSGLGLAIVDEIIQAHHGKFSLSSRNGDGTTAEIRLPIQ
ncbi:two-component sensor histidine kinase [Bacillus sp. MUM 116]|uniref:HAMP domain-containing sensor histidine kinase n=1 Tax=Bacillus sp. MUM 116 TaxID=1678002 RepID=UPI0008F5B5BA|nr:ATP-binding protein [Bacillus sp. MUM 116]OIK14174.1 two-component sensor histidine kinase [Bacillus sp. MUM 116]